MFNSPAQPGPVKRRGPVSEPSHGPRGMLANQVMGRVHVGEPSHGPEACWRTKSWAGGMLANQVMGRGHVSEPSHGPGACWRTSLGAVGEPVLGRGPVGEPVTAGGLLANNSWGEGLLANQSWGGGLLANQVKVQYMAFKTKSIIFSPGTGACWQDKIYYFTRFTVFPPQNKIYRFSLMVFPPQNKQSVYFHLDKTAVFVLCSTGNRSTSLQKVPVINCDRTEKSSKLKRAMDFFINFFINNCRAFWLNDV